MTLATALAWAGQGCSSATRVMDPPLHPPNPPGAWYVVKAGETWPEIAARTGVPLEDLLEINGQRRSDALMAGQVIYLLEPSGGAPAVAETLPPSAGGSPLSRGTPPAGTGARSIPPPPRVAPPPAVGNAPLRWPLRDPKVSSSYGNRQGKVHEGIDLAAPTGTPIFAAKEGFVLYAGDGVRGYGNMVVLQHPGELLTVYAHNSVVLVRTGDRVAAGQEIARVGMSGRASAPHLHFEVRQGEVPRDPMHYLPGLPSASR